MRLRPTDITEKCAAKTCKSFFSSPPKAAFLTQICTDMEILNINGLDAKEQGELAWEKAYREQLSGREPSSLALPMCAQCVAFTIAHYLGGEEYERQAAMFIAASVMKGEDIILFDRNLSRQRTDPAAIVGPFETLADFRRKYWEALETGA